MAVDPGLAAALARRTSLVVIDMQNDYCLPEGIIGLLGYDTSVFAPVAKRLTLFLSETRDYIRHRIFVRTVAPKWGRSRAMREQYSRSSLNRTAVPFLSDWYGVDPKDDIIIEKFRYSAFADTPLDAILRANDTETVVIAGVTTDVCVDTTARDAFMRDYEVIIVSDCTAATTPDRYRNSIDLLDAFFARCVTSDAVCAALPPLR